MAIIPTALQDLRNVWNTLARYDRKEEPLAFVLEHLRSIHEQLLKIPTHPFTVEPISVRERINATNSLNGIFADVLLTQDVTAPPQELVDIHQKLKTTLVQLAQLNKLQSLEKLKHLPTNLNNALRSASNTLQDFRAHYLNTPKDENSLSEAIDLMKEVFKTMSSHISMAHFGIKEVRDVLNDDFQSIIRTLPEYSQEARSSITLLYQSFSSCSQSLFFALREINEVLEELNLERAQFKSKPSDSRLCDEAREELSLIDRIEALGRGLKGALDNPGISAITLLFNMLRLQKLIEEREVMNERFIRALASLENEQRKTKYRLQDLTISNPKTPVRQHIEMTDCLRREAELKFTREHFLVTLANPRLAKCKSTLATLSAHPRIAPYLTEGCYTEPLRFDTDFWLIKPLWVRNKADCEQIRNSLNIYLMILKPLTEMFQGKTNPLPSFSNQKSPFITLANIEEALFGVASINS